MARQARPFSYRMFYATSDELIDYAARLGMNWVVVASSGHKGGQVEDDAPVYMRDYEKQLPHRESLAAYIEANRKRVTALIRRAKKAGLKVIYHSYEPSLPDGFFEAYPELYDKEISTYYKAGPKAVKNNRELCVTREDVQQAITAKVRETCEAFPDVDAFMFTNNESSSTTKVWHRCDRCSDTPYPDAMKCLHDAIKKGIEQSGRPIRLMNRCWGTHETDYKYWGSFQDTLDFYGGNDTEGWLKAWLKSFEPEHLHFKPSRDIPAYVKLLKKDGADTVFVYKATWADTNLNHPLNPWMGKYKGHDEVSEFSFEYCRDAPSVFYVMGKEMQRRAQTCRDKGVDGLCAVPICWGMHDVKARATAAHPSKWSLAELNIPLFQALCLDPDADLLLATRKYLKHRYGVTLHRDLAQMLLDSEDVAAAAMNVRGARATGEDLHLIFKSLLRYAPMRTGWRKRIAPTAANRKMIFQDKDDAVAQAKAMVARIEALKDGMPPAAYDEFKLCFGNLRNLAERYAGLHKAFYIAWAMIAKELPADAENMQAVTEIMARMLPPMGAAGEPGHRKLNLNAWADEQAGVRR